MAERTISYSRIDNFILFGGGLTLLAYAQALQKKSFNVFVYTAPRHASEPLDEEANTFEQLLQRAGLDYVVTDDINQEADLIDRVSSSTLGVGFGEAWQFNSQILAAFDHERLLDFMGIPLPRYRGGAHYTWMIQRGDRQGGFHLQIVDEHTKQGEHDSGEVIYSEPFEFPDSASTPMDYFNAAMRAESQCLLRFTDAVIHGRPFPIVRLDQSHSLFLPRLKTPVNGWVDWRWSSSDILRFINSFDDPYPGARTYLNGKEVVALKEVSLLDHEPGFHPFQYGLVVNVVDNSGIHVATESGVMLIQQVLDEQGQSVVASVQVGDRLLTPQAVLEAAMLAQPDYDASGVQTKESTTMLQAEQAVDQTVIQGERITLRPVQLEDCNETYLSWLQNPEINQYLETRWQPQTLASLESFVRGVNESDDSILFAIIDSESEQHIGNIKLGPINQHHQSADISYFLGEQAFWGRGYATEAVRLVVEYGFTQRSLQFIGAGCYGSNVASIKVLDKVGFNLQGMMKQALQGAEGREDHLLFGMTVDQLL